jgi:large subunit ribosomal protein L31
MKAKIHPQYNKDVKVTCTCGNTFVTGSTTKTIAVEVCYKCHPFYTGEQKFLDRKGRVETFKKSMAAAKQYKETASLKKQKKQDKGEHTAKTLRELLGEV